MQHPPSPPATPLQGPSRYCSLSNVADVAGSALLAAAFALRLYGSMSDEDAVDAPYAPESVYLALGLALLWTRVLLNLLGEFEPTAVLVSTPAPPHPCAST